MSILAIRQALELAVVELDPTIATAYENASFIKPEPSIPYQELYLLLAEPDNLEMSGNRYFERGIFQVNLYWPLNKGTKDIQERAELIKNAFPFGSAVSKDGQIVHVKATPEVGPGAKTGDRYMIPVRIRIGSHVVRS